MSLTLNKGQTLSLNKESGFPDEFIIGLGWDTNRTDTGKDFDLDAAVILVGEDYADYMTDLLTPIQDSMYKVLNHLDLFHKNRIFAKLKTRSVSLIDIVVLVEGTAETEAHANIIVANLEKLALPNIYVSRNGKSFSVTAFSNSYKQLACQYLIANTPEYQNMPTLGFGDSVSDLSFMSGCDFSVVPNTASTQISVI